MNGLPKASAVVIAVAAGLTVRPSAASVAAGSARARLTPGSVGHVIAVPRTVHTSQLLVMRDPLVAFESPLVFLKGVPSAFTAPGVNPNVTAGPLERVSISYLFWLNSKPH